MFKISRFQGENSSDCTILSFDTMNLFRLALDISM
jgi:hypothetical protein